MGEIISLTVRLIEAGRRAYARKWIFLGFFVVAFFGSIGALGALDLLPNTVSGGASSGALTGSESHVTTIVQTQAIVAPELPASIEIPKINIKVSIENPMTTDVEVLDKELLKGAVRYPTSAKLGETGNVVLFAHSSYLPIVGNQAYKSFNGIQKLAVGDSITVSSADTMYTYHVRSVTKESAIDFVIPLSVSGRVLTLATCDSFKSKDDRFVVVADFVESHSISI